MANDETGQNAVKNLLGHATRTPAPVHLWTPPYCGEIDIVIRRDGSWWHEGAPIRREGLVQLFASILKREGDRYYLVTPVEKLGIVVEDTPLLVTDLDGTTLITATGDRVVPGPDHPLRVADPNGTPTPYIHVRGGMEARIDRKTFYRLMDMAEERDGQWMLDIDGHPVPLGA
ncbi:DUF1285 domain-containing protein [Falsirhodobacter halotolerans]|uniref:DUF1285 domain-containing protein n=1 Tax=Falsirhodobacter halotolerans TaxID=1146892 RepID=UPI001FD1559B|nr:DUF1285 domain-containing protein [Falsirhodobacter halotolerans]MCJ8138797.1 DUF1285 domain-containing protein [Falsirhodobacter halotolerans]